MRTLILLILIVLCGNMPEIMAQNSTEQYPDTITLSEWSIHTIFLNYEKDTLGFRKLTSKTSLNEYKGKENKSIMRAMQSLKKSMDGSTMYNQIADKYLVTFWEGYPVRQEETHILRNVKYIITQKGVIVLGERSTIAPWNDILSHWKTISCYFIGFDKSVKLLETVFINTKKRFPTGIVEFLPDRLTYAYPDSIAGDSTIIQVTPTFREGEKTIKSYFEENIKYPMIALDNEIQGLVTASFTVNADASITQIMILRSVDPSLDKEVLRIIKTTANMWRPQLRNGKEMTVKVTIGIRFKLID